MKHLTYLLSTWALAALLVFSSCSDFLEVEPTNRLAVKTYEDVRKLMAGHLLAYKQDNDRVALSGVSRFMLDDQEWLLAHLYSDDYDFGRYLNNYAARNFQGFYLRSADWQNVETVEQVWRKYYTNIGFFNMILTELDKHPSTDQTLNEQVSGEARVLRAWQFFRLMQYFSPYKENAYGLPLNTDPDAVATYESKRYTQEENYKFIIDELEAVLAYTSTPSDGYNIFFDKRIVHGLLAQVYHYKGGSGAGKSSDYEKAIEHARALLSMGISYESFVTLPDASMGFDAFGIRKNKPYTPLSVLNNNTSIGPAIYGDSFYGTPQCASAELYSLFSDADKRKSAFLDSDRSIKKFNASFRYDYIQIEFFTGAEMQLIIAESLARLNKEADALTELNAFTATRYWWYQRPASETVLQSILNERRREFCFEYCMRWMDLTRLQTGFSRTHVQDDQKERTYTIADGDYRFCYPIPPKGERSQSNVPQNPGWGDL